LRQGAYLYLDGQVCEEGVIRGLAAITSEKTLSFLRETLETEKQQSYHGRYRHFRVCFNFVRAYHEPLFPNPRASLMLRKLYRNRKPSHWDILEKKTIDEIISRTTEVRNHLILKLAVRDRWESVKS
jgi:hypothetical protein